MGDIMVSTIYLKDNGVVFWCPLPPISIAALVPRLLKTAEYLIWACHRTSLAQVLKLCRTHAGSKWTDWDQFRGLFPLYILLSYWYWSQPDCKMGYSSSYEGTRVDGTDHVYILFRVDRRHHVETAGANDRKGWGKIIYGAVCGGAFYLETSGRHVAGGVPVLKNN
jgi:hypothetical protein